MVTAIKELENKIDSISKENEYVILMNIRVETFLLAAAIFLSVTAIGISSMPTKPTYLMVLFIVVFSIIAAGALGALQVYLIKRHIKKQEEIYYSISSAKSCIKE
ncbi:MAG: hypothetical protein QW530_01385 [Candidatus Micrarchaeaceae archaeon]